MNKKTNKETNKEINKEKLYKLRDSIHQYNRSCSNPSVQSLSSRLGRARGDLGNMVDNINRINRLSQILDKVMEPPMINHCKAAHWRNNVLVLAVDSGEWANRLRYEKLNLLTKLRQTGFPKINSIDIIVQPDDFC